MIGDRSALRTVASLTLLLLGAACARSDLGAPCHLQDVAGAEVQPQPGREYIYLGSSECESFACLATPGSGGAYCSQACSGAGGTCPSGLNCQQLTLNPAYLDAMKARLPAERYNQLFGQLGSSWYCVRGARR
jgi:hypothetical protein